MAKKADVKTAESSSSPTKIKLLKLLEILRQETDELHPLTTNELTAKLEEAGIGCDRRTLSNDIATLNEYGYEVMSIMSGHHKAYYVEDRNFSLPELKILIDAVQAAAFITDKKTDELIGKIASMGGSHRAELLTQNLVCFNTRKHSNEGIYYNVGFLEEALQQHRKVSFLYYDLDESGKKQYRRNRARYLVDPSALIYNEDNYYLMTWSDEHYGVTNYRVDRMSDVRIEDAPASEIAVIHTSEVADYTEQAFKMYTGEECAVTLAFDDSLIGVVYDKFGEDTKMTRTDEHTVTAEVTVQVSPTFLGWLMQFPGKMKILAPEELISQCQEWIGRFSVICSLEGKTLQPHHVITPEP